VQTFCKKELRFQNFLPTTNVKTSLLNKGGSRRYIVAGTLVVLSEKEFCYDNSFIQKEQDSPCRRRWPLASGNNSLAVSVDVSGYVGHSIG